MNQIRHDPMRYTGFTLIELLIVLAIIGLLAAMSIPNLLSALDKSKQVSSVGLLKGVGQALELYRVDNGFNPVAASTAVLLPLLNPYSSSLRTRDEWKNRLGYEANEVNAYSVECYGKDGLDGVNISPETRYIFNLDIVYSNGGFTAGIE